MCSWIQFIVEIKQDDTRFDEENASTELRGGPKMKWLICYFIAAQEITALGGGDEVGMWEVFFQGSPAAGCLVEVE